MAVPESQLETWSHQGSVTQSSSTYGTIRTALTAPDSPYAAKDCEVFLQGSYGNDTNIYSESDVDVVIELRSIFYHDLERLPQVQKDAFAAANPDATYEHGDFKRDVVSHLQKEFGAAVNVGAKAVTISPRGNRREADVLIASQFRRYHRFISTRDQNFDRGICFFTSSGVRVENYPRQHSENCTSKHQSTNSWFKPMVRVFKNLRSRLVDDGSIAPVTAPSYYIEGLLYNVPADRFGGTYSNCFVSVLNWILEADRSKFVCANEQYYLLRDAPNVTWAPAHCEAFLNAVVTAWNAW